MPAGDMPQRERRVAVTFLVEHASDFDVLKIYGKKPPLRKSKTAQVSEKVTKSPPVALSKSSKKNGDAKEVKKAVCPPKRSRVAPPVPKQSWVYPVSIVGERLPMRFDPNMTVEQFKRKMEHVHGVPVPHQRYFVGTREWQKCDKKTLAEVGLYEGCVFLLANKIGAPSRACSDAPPSPMAS